MLQQPVNLLTCESQCVQLVEEAERCGHDATSTYSSDLEPYKFERVRAVVGGRDLYAADTEDLHVSFILDFNIFELNS